MNFSIQYKGTNYPLNIRARFEHGEVIYESMTQESYECLDGHRRNFTASGPTLRDCFSNTLRKIITHQPQ